MITTLDVVCDIASRMLYVEPDHVVYHHRKKRYGKEQHEVQDDQSLTLTVKENGLQFLVDLTKRIDTGLFLDQSVAPTGRARYQRRFGCTELVLLYRLVQCLCCRRWCEKVSPRSIYRLHTHNGVSRIWPRTDFQGVRIPAFPRMLESIYGTL